MTRTANPLANLRDWSDREIADLLGTVDRTGPCFAGLRREPDGGPAIEVVCETWWEAYSNPRVVRVFGRADWGAPWRLESAPRRRSPQLPNPLTKPR